MPTHKLFCYVDETGQDTRGAFFVVSVVITPHDRDRLRRALETIERTSRKGRRKWTHTKPAARAAYIDEVLRGIAPDVTLAYDVYPNTTNYPAKTVLTIARSIALVATDATKATVFVDGLRRAQYHWFGAGSRGSPWRTGALRHPHRQGPGSAAAPQARPAGPFDPARGWPSRARAAARPRAHPSGPGRHPPPSSPARARPPRATPRPCSPAAR